MKNFDYFQQHQPILDPNDHEGLLISNEQMNAMGHLGWELVSTVPTKKGQALFIYKRPVPETQEDNKFNNG